MRKEHYKEFEIQMTYNKVCKENDDLMKKYMMRFKLLQNKDRRILMILWNRWREFVGIRKLLKHNFKFCHNSTRDTKADL